MTEPGQARNSHNTYRWNYEQVEGAKDPELRVSAPPLQNFVTLQTNIHNLNVQHGKPQHTEMTVCLLNV